MAVDAGQNVKCVDLLPCVLPEEAQDVINNSLDELRKRSSSKNFKEELKKLGLFYIWQNQAEICINKLSFTKITGLKTTQCRAVYIARMSG